MEHRVKAFGNAIAWFCRWSAVGVALFLASCATGDGSRLQSIEEEIILGPAARARLITSSGGLYRNRDLEDYLGEVLERLIPHAAVPAGFGKLAVSILDTAEPNAYATAGGGIFVTRGMLAMMNDESELAGVLAHEIGHVAKRHVAEILAEQKDLIRSVEREAFNDLRYAGGARSRRLRILQSAYDARASELTEFSRSQELEADRVSQTILAKAGYSGGGLTRVVARNDRYRANLEKRLGLSETELDDLVKTSRYPKTEERLAELMRVKGDDSAPRQQDRLMAEIDGLKYGEDFTFGYIRDGAFWKPEARISFAVPDTLIPVQFGGMGLVARGGFIVFHSDSDDNEAAERIVTAMIDEDLGFARVEKKTLNDLPVTSGVAKIDNDGVPYEIRTHVYEVGTDKHSLTMFRKVDAKSEFLSDYRMVTESFRAVEAGAWPARPRLRTRKVATGETVETLAAQSATDGDAAFSFRLMNGLEPEQRLQPGDWIKLVE